MKLTMVSPRVCLRSGFEAVLDARTVFIGQRTPGKRRSPLGDLAAQATAEGYDVNKPLNRPSLGLLL